MEDRESGADVIIGRMIKAIGGNTQADLSKILEVSAASISAARRKGKIPPEWIVKLAILKGASPAWIKYGHGPLSITFPGSSSSSSYDKMTYIVQSVSRLHQVIEVRNDVKKTIDYLVFFVVDDSCEYLNIDLRCENPSDAAKINLIRTTCWDVGVDIKQVRVPERKIVYFTEDPPMNLSEALDEAAEFGEDVQDVLKAYIKEAGAVIEEIKPRQTDLMAGVEEADRSIFELLNMASKVLESETIYKSSLALSIMALHRAMEVGENAKR